MNECKGYKIYVNDINTKHLFSVSNKIVFFASEIGSTCVVVNDDICHHVYLDTYTTKAIIAAVDKYNSIAIQRDFDALSDFEAYLVQNGIYVAYFFWQESSDMTEFNMFYHVRELIPPGGLVRLRSGGLYNIVAHDYSALFIRNVDSAAIMSYYTDVVGTFIEHYGKLTPRLLMSHKLFNLYAARTMLQYALEANSSEDNNTDLIKSMYDIVDDIIALIELASL